jgi:small-conductance mechanosensitive channel
MTASSYGKKIFLSMLTQFFKTHRIILTCITALLVVSILISCSAPEPDGTPTSPEGSITATPEPPTTTQEPASDEGAQGILLPSATHAPTLTPGAIDELISQFAETTGLQEVTVLRVSVEDWLNLFYSILLTLIFGFLISRLVYFVVVKATARTETKYDDIFIEKVRRPIFVIIVTLGFQLGTVRLSLIEALVKLRVNRLAIAIYVAAAIVIVWHLVDVLVEWYQNEVEPKRADPHQVDTLLLLLHRFARIILIMIGMIMLLSLYGINVNALIAALGVGSLAISLAAQDTLSNVISGIMIMMDQPFRVGDRIEIQTLGTWGDVVDIGLRSTRIRTNDNRLVIVPNNVISTDQVVNYTYPDPRYRIQIELGVGYRQDIEKARGIIIDTVRKVAGVLPSKPVDALVVNMGEYSITIQVRWWIQSYQDTRRMYDRVYTALMIALDEAGIEVPTSTYDVNIVNLPGATNDVQFDESN